MKFNKIGIILPLTAIIALCGTGFAAWVFSEGITSDKTGANLEVTDAYDYSDLRVTWIKQDLTLEQDHQTMKGKAINSISFSVEYDVTIAAGGLNTYDDAKDKYNYQENTFNGDTKIMDFGYSVKLLSNTVSEYVTSKVSVNEKGSSAYRSFCNVASISDVNDIISVTDEITFTDYGTVTVTDIVTVSFEWKNAPENLAVYENLKAAMTAGNPLTFQISTNLPKEVVVSDKKTDTLEMTKALQDAAKSSNNVIFAKYTDKNENDETYESIVAMSTGIKAGEAYFYTIENTDDETGNKTTTTYVLSNNTQSLSSYTKITGGLVTSEGKNYLVAKSGFLGITTTAEILGIDEQGDPIQDTPVLEETTIQNLTIKNIDVSNMTNFDGMFSMLGSIKKVDVSFTGFSKVESIGDMFAGSASLETVSIAFDNTDSLKVVTGMFSACVNLTTISTNEDFTSNVNITLENSKNMFAGCTSLKGVNGTTYDSNHVDKTYARIDADDTPGYFTPKSA